MDVVTIGETMVLFTPKSFGYMRYAAEFSTKVGGAESNVAIGLARLGHQAGWISRLGQDEFGRKILLHVRGEGVDVSQVRFDSDAATGIYFKELLTENEFRVQYYRKHSAASRMEPGDLDEGYLADAKFLHVTGITPALSESCRETVKHAMRLAKKNGVPVVFDPNLRFQLWGEEEARKVITELASEADIILPGLAEGAFLFGSLDPERMAERFYENGAGTVVLKLGAEGAYYFSGRERGYVEAFDVERVVDPVGAGDGFATGFLSGLLDGVELREAVRRGAAVGAMVTMVPGDVEGLPDRDRLDSFMTGGNQEDVKR